ncbi:MAG: cryptochrome/photolyase family protein, partial [Proteobacteria bacterium]|nr:cryptochrome/photolyase family protein [Pseudomonadota bacterium]
EALHARQPSTEPDLWLFVPYDQLTAEVGPLSRADPSAIGVVLIESRWKAERRAVHQQKLMTVLSNQRHFALEQAERGVRIDYRFTRGDYRSALEDAVDRHGPISMMRAAERELRENLAPLVAQGGLRVLPHEGWLTTPEQFREALPEPPFRMDVFYRAVRRGTGLLMEEGAPLGGRFSHDGDNRKPWRGEPAAPSPPRFEVDAIDAEVAELIASDFSSHPGAVDPAAVPTTHAQAEAAWAWAMADCMEHFGPYEDAMSKRSRTLFHTRIAPLLNQLRLLPQRVVSEVAAMEIPINSREGFVRQVLGWREFVRHVHDVSDGFRRPGFEAGQLTAAAPLPPAYWGEASGLACLDEAVEQVWSEGWTHHIPRLMVLSNIAVLLDVSPRELTDWFWVAFTDAYDWVVEPNVLGMGTFSTGELMTTKPYIAGAGYIHRMSDYCRGCAFDPKRSCPLTPMYWAWLARHDDEVDDVSRLRRQLWSARRRSPEKRERDARIFEWVSKRLAQGERLEPSEVPT